MQHLLELQLSPLWVAHPYSNWTSLRTARPVITAGDLPVSTASLWLQ
jgi:hypothetical protein